MSLARELGPFDETPWELEGYIQLLSLLDGEAEVVLLSFSPWFRGQTNATFKFPFNVSSDSRLPF